MDVFLEHTLEGAGANDCAADSAADEFCRNSKSRRIRDASGRIRDASGIGINSAGVCIWPIGPLSASSSAQPAAALRDLFLLVHVALGNRHVLVGLQVELRCVCIRPAHALGSPAGVRTSFSEEGEIPAL